MIEGILEKKLSKWKFLVRQQNGRLVSCVCGIGGDMRQQYEMMQPGDSVKIDPLITKEVDIDEETKEAIYITKKIYRNNITNNNENEKEEQPQKQTQDRPIKPILNKGLEKRYIITEIKEQLVEEMPVYVARLFPYDKPDDDKEYVYEKKFIDEKDIDRIKKLQKYVITIKDYKKRPITDYEFNETDPIIFNKNPGDIILSLESGERIQLDKNTALPIDKPLPLISDTFFKTADKCEIKIKIFLEINGKIEHIDDIKIKLNQNENKQLNITLQNNGILDIKTGDKVLASTPLHESFKKIELLEKEKQENLKKQPQGNNYQPNQPDNTTINAPNTKTINNGASSSESPLPSTPAIQNPAAIDTDTINTLLESMDKLNNTFTEINEIFMHGAKTNILHSIYHNSFDMAGQLQEIFKAGGIRISMDSYFSMLKQSANTIIKSYIDYSENNVSPTPERVEEIFNELYKQVNKIITAKEFANKPGG